MLAYGVRSVVADEAMNWIDSYYDALEFFYGEPQHLRKKMRNGGQPTSLAEVRKRLRAIEVPLNHNLHQFFRLAPGRLVEAIFAAAFGYSPTGPFELHGRNVDRDFRLKNSVQPDLLFTADQGVVSIEMKIGAKCSPQQVLKYALLGLAVERHFHRDMMHHFLLVGCGEFRDQWSKPLGSVSDLRRALLEADLDAFLKARPIEFRLPDRFTAIVHEMRLAFLSYDSLASVLMQAIPNEGDSSDGAEVYRKLLDGLLDELKRRQLIECAGARRLPI